MFESLKRLWEKGLATLATLRNAVLRAIPWITPAQYEEITGQPFEQ